MVSIFDFSPPSTSSFINCQFSSSEITARVEVFYYVFKLPRVPIGSKNDLPQTLKRGNCYQTCMRLSIGLCGQNGKPAVLKDVLNVLSGLV